jgi:hypothetical protein
MPKPMMTTTIRVSPGVWQALRALAEDRALTLGGRPSASAVIEALVTEAAAKSTRRPDAD